MDSSRVKVDDCETIQELNADNVGIHKGACRTRSKVSDVSGKVYSETMTAYVADADGVAPFFSPFPKLIRRLRMAPTNSWYFRLPQDMRLRMTTMATSRWEYHHGDLTTTSDDRSIFPNFWD